MITLPRWFPQFDLYIEMRPLFSVGTRIMCQSYETHLFEYLRVKVSVLSWSWEFNAYRTKLREYQDQ